MIEAHPARAEDEADSAVITPLRAGHEPTRLILDSAHEAFASIDARGVVNTWNRAAEATFGWTSEEAVGRELAGLIIPERHREAHHRGLEHFLATGQGEVLDRRIELDALHRDGHELPVEITISALRIGETVSFNAFVHDISDRRRDEMDLRRLAAVVEASDDAILSGTPEGTILSFNPAAERLYGYRAEEVIGRSVGMLRPEGDLSGVAELQERLQSGEPVTDFETQERRKDGSLIDVSITVSPLRDRDGRVTGMSAIARDIGPRKAAADKLRGYAEHLRELALHDPLTGLRNYRDFHATIDRELERCRRHGGVFSVVLLDVDGLKAVNDFRGHQAGDRLLRAVADEVARVCRSSDTAARIGGDEFALVLPATAEAGAERAAARIAAAVAALGEGVTVSCGTAAWPDAGDTKELVLMRADMALYAAKPTREPAGTAARRTDAQGRATDRIERLLARAREQLGTDIAFVGKFAGGREVFTLVDGDAASFGLEEGSELPLDETFCARMVDGRIGNLVVDAREDPETSTLPVTAEAGVGCYAGVPIRLADGEIFGALCGVSHAARPDLSEADVSLLRFIAGLIGEALDEERERAREHRLENELVGIDALLAALQARDEYTSEHSRHVVSLVGAVARRLDLSPRELEEAEQVALLHDIGKVGIPDSVLHKSGPLDDPEWELMRQHPVVGERIVASTESLAHLAGAVRAEHERWDGGGYPDGLSGAAIPIASRIVLACDAWDAMTTDRPYRAALKTSRALDELRRNAGAQFDPAVVRVLLEVIEGAPGPAPEATPRTGVATGSLAGSSHWAPVWKPRVPQGGGTSLREVRAACRRCGAHTDAVLSRQTLSGSCGNCASYELDLLDSKPVRPPPASAGAA